jgi:septal ring factor EnvC (AmiA/AmiB activator)
MLDPFEVILDRARNGENIVSEIKSLYAKQDELRQAVANLEREEKKAKARLRSARTSILFAENDLKNIEQGIKQCKSPAERKATC